jgi:large subunit ribosomal protein L10
MEGYVAMVRTENIAAVDSIKQKTEKSSILLFVDFRGLTVGEITNLRRKLHKEDAGLTVYKNTLARIAFKEMEISCPDNLLVGPSGIIYTESDPVAPAKVLLDFQKEHKNLAIKGGLLDKSFIKDSEIINLAKLPGKDALMQKAVGLMKSPITKFVMTLSNPMRNFVYALDAIKEKK